MEWWPRRCRLTVALLLILLAVAHRDVLAGAAVPPGTGGVVGGVHTDPHRIGGAGASGDDDVVTQASAPAGKHTRKRLTCLSYPPRVLSYVGYLGSMFMVVVF